MKLIRRLCALVLAMLLVLSLPGWSSQLSPEASSSQIESSSSLPEEAPSEPEESSSEAEEPPSEAEPGSVPEALPIPAARPRQPSPLSPSRARRSWRPLCWTMTITSPPTARSRCWSR